MENKPESQTTNKLGLIIGMSTAILLVTPVIILLVIGYFLDSIFHTSPLYLVIGIIVGFISGVVNVYRLMKLMQRRKNQDLRPKT
jgi:F0F1-type ATP synthase assembly protein I